MYLIIITGRLKSSIVPSSYMAGYHSISYRRHDNDCSKQCFQKYSTCSHPSNVGAKLDH